MYYLGINKSTVEYSNFFEKLILLNGNDEFSYKSIFGDEKIDFNDMKNFSNISPNRSWYACCIKKIKTVDKNAKFMIYNPAVTEFMDDVSDVVCLNDIKLIKTLNNKPECKHLLKNEINFLDYKYLKADEISYSNLNKLFHKRNGKYVVQQPIGFGGEGTFLFDKKTKLDLDKNTTYSVSEYIENSTPINNTFVIADNNILIFDGSVQIIKADKELRYDGYDFKAYKRLDKSLQIKIYEQTLKIAQKLQLLGYRGIGGVDYIIDNEQNIFFMEINPRFQVSSREIDRQLIKQKLPSIFELNYLSFYDGKKFKEYCDIINSKKVDDFIEIKLNLMTDGVALSDNAKDYLINHVGKKFFNNDYITTRGIMLEFGGIYVTCHIDKNSQYEVDYDKELFVRYKRSIFPVKCWKPWDNTSSTQADINRIKSSPVYVHFDRARISPISGCNNHCAFCSMNEIPYKKNSIQTLDEAFKYAIQDKRITHVLISGGSPKPQDLPYLTEVYEYFCKKYKNLDFDVMMTPRGFDSYTDTSQYEEYLKHLKKIGVKGLSINLELYNDKICSKYCREKFEIGKQNYLKFLTLASKIFGIFYVRSGLIVGLEPVENTLKAVKEICKCGCMPMLSPYMPYKNIGHTPSTKFLLVAYKRTQKILKKYNCPLAPTCPMCRHNTL